MDTVGTFKEADNPTQQASQETTTRNDLEKQPRNESTCQSVKQPRSEVWGVALISQFIAVVEIDAFLAAIEAIFGAAVMVFLPAFPVYGMFALGDDSVALLEIIFTIIALLEHHILAVFLCLFGIELLDIFFQETLVLQPRHEE